MPLTCSGHMAERECGWDCMRHFNSFGHNSGLSAMIWEQDRTLFAVHNPQQ
jgi:hypothetical protein